MLTNTLDPTVYDCLLPRPQVRTVDWADGHVPSPPPVAGTIRFDLFPYMVEPIDCMDSPDYDRVTLQMASRTGKTTGVQCFALRVAATDPHNMAWGEPDEPSLRRVINRTWQMALGTSDLAGKCPVKRSSREMAFTDCLIHGAYSGSVSTAADFAAKVVVLNELSKFTFRRRRDDEGADAGEADFPKLLAERTKGYPGSTIVEMSTPTVKGRCRIEAQRLLGDNRQYYVPCPHCNRFQTLKTGRTHAEVGGIKFKKGAEGKLDAAVAEETAWYECEHCRKKILDEHRYKMMTAGRWVKDGQRIDKRGRLRGKPKRSGRHASFGPLGTHYSLLPGITWGRIAREYVESKQDPLRRAFRNFINAWEAQTWDPSPVVVQPHELAHRLRSDLPRGTIPSDSMFTTLAVDTGVSGSNLLFYWMLAAWRNNGSGHVVDWGFATGETELSKVLEETKPFRAGLDSGGGRDDIGDAVTERVYAICRGRRHVWPLKGSSTSLGTDWYSSGFQRSGATPRELRRKKLAGLGDLLIVNTTLSQSWRESLITGRLKPGELGFVSLPVDVSEQPELYADFLDELTSDVEVDGRWTKRGPNEFGDTLRYCRVLAELATRGGKLWGRLDKRQKSQEKKNKPFAAATAKDRWNFLGPLGMPSLQPGKEA